MLAGALTLLLLSVSVAPHSLAQDAPLRAAVAPAQTVVDAVTRILLTAVSEAIRDGTPDEAMRLEVLLTAFVMGLEDDAAVSDAASHAQEARAAVAYARQLAAALGSLTTDVTPFATSPERCSNAKITTEAYLDIIAARAELRIVAAEFAALAATPPPGVDTSSLAAAAAGLEHWAGSFQPTMTCQTTAPVANNAAYLRFTVKPLPAWRTGTLAVNGVTGLPGTVTVTSASLGWNATLPVDGGRFRESLEVPIDTPLGNHAVRVSVGNLSQTQNVPVVLAVSNLTVSAPARIAENATLAIRVTLDSQAPERTRNATVQMTSVAQPVRLANGAATVDLGRQPDAGTRTFTLTFAGDDVVAPATRTFSVLIQNEAQPPAGPAIIPAPVPVPISKFDGRFWIPLVVLGLALVVAVALLARRSKSPPPSHHAELPTPQEAPDRLPRGLVAVFAFVAATLRRRGLVRADQTVREWGPLLDHWELADPNLVTRFEESRYGGRPIDEAIEERAKSWLARLKEKLSGAGP